MLAESPSSHVAELCHHLGGVARRSQLVALDVDDRSLRRAVASGEVARIRPGMYANSDLPEPIRVALRHGGVLACVSVARLRGLWVLPLDDLVHVSMAPNGHSHAHGSCRCALHWNAASHTPTQVSLVDALLQIRGCHGADAFFATLESALHTGELTAGDRGALRRRITESARWIVDLARSDAESGLESLLRIRLHRIGLTLRTQVEIPGVGRVDFVLGDRLILEVDGRLNHDEPTKRHKDLVRDAVAASHGFATLRFDYELVVHDWPLVEAAVLATVARGLHLEAWAARVRSTSRSDRVRVTRAAQHPLDPIALST